MGGGRTSCSRRWPGSLPCRTRALVALRSSVPRARDCIRIAAASCSVVAAAAGRAGVEGAGCTPLASAFSTGTMRACARASLSTSSLVTVGPARLASVAAADSAGASATASSPGTCAGACAGASAAGATSASASASSASAASACASAAALASASRCACSRAL